MNLMMSILTPFLLMINFQLTPWHGAVTEKIHISGVCAMCDNRIEHAGSIKHMSEVKWDNETQEATLTYRPTKITRNEILKRIALAGHDNEVYLAPDEAYNQLPKCCQYDRVFKQIALNSSPVSPQVASEPSKVMDPVTMIMPNEAGQELQPVFDAYFNLKDALVQSDGNAGYEKSQLLLAALKKVDMTKLGSDEHMTWMKLQPDLVKSTEKITQTKDVNKQREQFAALSDQMYQLMKASKAETPVYYQRCPMYNNGKGANWLSKDSNIKNPYYGSMMMTCGKTLETL